jgi:hypothetical protein
LEITQLQAALRALSEKLKLFQNIDNERELVQSQLKSVTEARDELQTAIAETTTQTKAETLKFE